MEWLLEYDEQQIVPYVPSREPSPNYNRQYNWHKSIFRRLDIEDNVADNHWIEYNG